MEPPGIRWLIFSLMAGAERNYSVLNRNKYGVAIDWRKRRPGYHQATCRHVGHFVTASFGHPRRSRLGYESQRITRISSMQPSRGSDRPVRTRKERPDIIAQATSVSLEQPRRSGPTFTGVISYPTPAAIACLLAVIHRMKTGHGCSSTSPCRTCSTSTTTE